jgi:hypothetical protein
MRQYDVLGGGDVLGRWDDRDAERSRKHTPPQFCLDEPLVAIGWIGAR